MGRNPAKPEAEEGRGVCGGADSTHCLFLASPPTLCPPQTKRPSAGSRPVLPNGNTLKACVILNSMSYIKQSKTKPD